MSKLAYEARKIKNELPAVFIAHKSIQVNEKKRSQPRNGGSTASRTI